MNAEIGTSRGTYYEYFKPHKSAVTVEVVAHALSNLCRFTGHCREFYSVAQHSVLVSHLVPLEDSLAGLLHDATEAYVNDIASPLKQLLPDYQKVEAMVAEFVLPALGVPAKLPDTVKRADMVALGMEKRDLMNPRLGDWAVLNGLELPQLRIVPMSPDRAKRAFLDRYKEITSQPHVYGARKQ